MRRKAWFRFVASLLAVWFPLVVGEPSLLQPCPMHSVAAAAAVTHSGDHSMHGAMHNSNGHSGVSVSQAPDGGASHTHHICSCIGSCGASSVSSAVAPRAPEPVIIATVAAHGACPVADALPRPAPEYARPYTTGPPLA